MPPGNRSALGPAAARFVFVNRAAGTLALLPIGLTPLDAKPLTV